MDFLSAQRDLNARFIYKRDQGDTWHILKSSGEVRGDCEDYSLTLVWLVEGKSMLRFWLALITFKYVIWFCHSPAGVGHAVLWARGIGWTDNIQRGVVERATLKEHGYRLRYAHLPLVVAMKMLFRPLMRFKRS